MSKYYIRLFCVQTLSGASTVDSLQTPFVFSFTSYTEALTRLFKHLNFIQQLGDTPARLDMNSRETRSCLDFNCNLFK